MFKQTSGETTIYLRPLRLEDLELVLAWRSDTDIYEDLLQQSSPLKWEEHLTWFAERPPSRRDFIIEYDGRRVGVVSINKDDMITIYVGEKGVWGNGIGTLAVEWLCEHCADRVPRTKVSADNTRSRAIFEGLDFCLVDTSDSVCEYVYEGDNEM
jgi:RimJ/RimL family protein N-acetyltransferase